MQVKEDLYWNVTWPWCQKRKIYFSLFVPTWRPWRDKFVLLDTVDIFILWLWSNSLNYHCMIINAKYEEEDGAGKNLILKLSTNSWSTRPFQTYWSSYGSWNSKLIPQFNRKILFHSMKILLWHCQYFDVHFSLVMHNSWNRWSAS